jgi:hypothetical protein
MQTDLALLKIRKAIIHEVPRRARNLDPGGPVLSELESSLDSELELYFKQKIIDSLKSGQAFDIVFDPQSTSPVPGLLLRYTAVDEDNDFVSMSQEMAKHLYSIQTGTNPAGLLIAIGCSAGDSRAFAIIKLEKEQGARIAQQTVGGKKTFDITLLRDLILTEKTKVFKVGLFVQKGDTLQSFDAAASDHQRGLYQRTELADFFLKRFLGCKLAEEPEVSTKRFYDVAEEFINVFVEDPIRRTRYHGHLVSELTSESRDLSPKLFAEKYLVTADRQKFLTYLKEQSGPTGTFSLNRELIQSRLEKRLYEFESGVSILTPAAAEHDRVKLTRLESGEVHAEVRDFLKNVRGKR